MAREKNGNNFLKQYLTIINCFSTQIIARDEAIASAAQLVIQWFLTSKIFYLKLFYLLFAALFRNHFPQTCHPDERRPELLRTGEAISLESQFYLFKLALRCSLTSKPFFELPHLYNPFFSMVNDLEALCPANHS